MAEELITARYNVTGTEEGSKKVSGLKGAVDKLRAGFMTITVAIGGLIATFKNFYNAAFRQAQVIKQTEQVIRSTGGAAGITAKEVTNLANEMQKVTNVGDEVVQSGQNMLLTFTNIGKNIFPEATERMLDMATVMNNGVTPSAEMLKGTAIQLGKALNDPILGATALRRVGVNLTEQQKEQIEVFVRSGERLKAQQIILKELATEFGGMARALADPVTQAGNAFDDFKESIGKLIMGAMVPIAKWVLYLKDGFDQLSPTGQKVVAAIVLIGIALMALIPVVVTLGTSMSLVLGGIPLILAGIATGVAFVAKAIGNTATQLDRTTKKIEDLKRKQREAEEGEDTKKSDKLLAQIEELEEKKNKLTERKREEDRQKELEGMDRQSQAKQEKNTEQDQLWEEQKALKQQLKDEEWAEDLNAWTAFENQKLFKKLENNQLMTKEEMSQLKKIADARKQASTDYVNFVAKAAEEEKNIGRAVAIGTLEFVKEGLKKQILAKAAGLVEWGWAEVMATLGASLQGWASIGAGVTLAAAGVQAINAIQLAEGGRMIVDRPTQIGANVIAGEGREPEEIKVTPLNQVADQNLTININMDGDTIATRVLKIGAQQRREGTIDDGL